VRCRAAVLQQVAVTDGRLMVGTLQCFDKQGNIIMVDTREFLPNRRERRQRRGS